MLASFFVPIVFLIPQLVILLNTYLGAAHGLERGMTRHGLSSFYRLLALGGILNWAYAWFAIITYYPTCGGGRHGCSFLSDATVNIPSQITTADVILTTVLALVYIQRESTLFSSSRINGWRYVIYTVLGSACYSLPSYFDAQLPFLHNSWVRKGQDEREKKVAERVFKKLRRGLEERFEKTEFNEYQVLDVIFSYVGSATTYMVLYALIGFTSLMIIGFNAPSMLFSIQDSFTNYGNKFMTVSKFILWVVIGSRSLSGPMGFRAVVVPMFVPIFSVSIAFAWYLVTKEFHRIGQKTHYEDDFSVSLKDYQLNEAHRHHLEEEDPIDAYFLDERGREKQLTLDAVMHLVQKMPPTPRSLGSNSSRSPRSPSASPRKGRGRINSITFRRRSSSSGGTLSSRSE